MSVITFYTKKNSISVLSVYLNSVYKMCNFSIVFSISDTFTSNQLTTHDCKNNNTNSNHKTNNNSNIVINNNILLNNKTSNGVSNGNKNAVAAIEISNKLNLKTSINNSKNSNLNNNNNVNFSTKIGEKDAKTDFTTFDESATNDADFFAAFNENFSKNRRNSKEMVDAFGVGFNSNSTVDGKFENTSPGGFRNNNLGAHTKNTSSPLTTDCVDNFEHKFSTLNINNAKESKLGFEDEDGFADFSAFNATSKTSKSNTWSHSSDVKVKTSPRKLNPIRGSDFEKLNANTADAAAKVVPKFSVDYSKSDQFDDDLQAALQRSLVDQ